MDTCRHPGIVFTQIYSSRREKYPFKEEHLETVGEVSENSELAEYVSDGFFQDREL
jgi:hypothetical protein